MAPALGRTSSARPIVAIAMPARVARAGLRPRSAKSANGTIRVQVAVTNAELAAVVWRSPVTCAAYEANKRAPSSAPSRSVARPIGTRLSIGHSRAHVSANRIPMKRIGETSTMAPLISAKEVDQNSVVPTSARSATRRARMSVCGSDNVFFDHPFQLLLAGPLTVQLHPLDFREAVRDLAAGRAHLVDVLAGLLYWIAEALHALVEA